MLNRIVRANVFDLGVGDAAVVFEERWQPSTGDVAALVDRGRQYRATVLAIPNGIIGTTAEEGDTKRSASDDHGSFPGNKAGPAATQRRSL